MKKLKAILFLTFVLFVISIGCYFTYEKENVIYVYNKTEKQIDHIEITVCNTTYILENIQSMAEKKIVFSITGDSGFVVLGNFTDKTKIKGTFGYVTKNYAKEIFKIIITSNGTVRVNSETRK